MKKIVLIAFFTALIFLISGPNIYAASVPEGRSLLFDSDNPTCSGLIAANQQFEDVLASEPNNEEANLFFAVTSVMAFALESGSGESLETLRDVFVAFGMSRNTNDYLDGNPLYNRVNELPENSPSGEDVRQFLAGPYMTLLNEALDNLDKITNDFQTTLTPEEIGEALEVDYGDVLMYKTMLNLSKYLALIISSYNLNMDTDTIVNKFNNDQFNINTDLLKPYPEFIKLRNDGQTALETAETVLLNSINTYLEASEFIRSETDDQWDDLIAIDSEDSDDEAHFRNNLNVLKDSLNNNVTASLESDGKQLSLNLNPFFGYGSGPYDLRDFLPLFDRCGQPKNGTMGNGIGNDPTLGGILPDYSQADWGFETLHCSIIMPWIYLLLLE